MIRHRAIVPTRAVLLAGPLAACSRSPYSPPPETRVDPVTDTLARIDPDGDYQTVVDPLALRADGTTSVGIEALRSMTEGRVAVIALSPCSTVGLGPRSGSRT
jgi:hypothetical protein